MKSILVIGMGRFGRHLAAKMLELGNDVMIIDKDESIIEELAPTFTDALAGDCTNEAVLRSVGVNNFDICFVAIGENFQSSLEITALLHELGAKYIVSKSNRDKQAKFLMQNGADEVVYPERDIAEKLAIRHTPNSVFDFIEMTPEYSIYELSIMDSWIGKSIAEIDVRRKYHINIVAVKRGDRLNPSPGADYIFSADDHIIVISRMNDVYKFTKKI